MSDTAKAQFTTAVRKYVTDTVRYMDVIEKYLCDFPFWWQNKKAELKEIEDIKAKFTDLKAKKIVLDRSDQEQMLQTRLSEVFVKTQKSYEGTREVLDAIEKLAVTSLAVFSNTNPFLEFPPGANCEKVHLFVNRAQQMAPFLVNFLQDPKDLFKDGLENVLHLDYQQKLYCQLLYQLYYNLKRLRFYKHWS